MALLDYVDRYVSTLSGGYTSGGGSLSVTAAPSGVSGACNLYVIVQAEGANTEEVFLVTNISGTTLTVTGAQAGTSASNHGAGAIIIGSIMTKAAFQQTSGLLLISDQVLGSPAATVTFSSIPQTFKHLRLEINAAGSAATAGDSFWMQVNGDTAAHYSVQIAKFVNTTATIVAEAATAKPDFGVVVCASGVANAAGNCTITLQDYASSVFTKNAMLIGGGFTVGSTIVNANLIQFNTWWNWNSTAAITSILFGLTTGSNFVTGSRFTLYGLT